MSTDEPAVVWHEQDCGCCERTVVDGVIVQVLTEVQGTFAVIVHPPAQQGLRSMGMAKKIAVNLAHKVANAIKVSNEH